MSVMNITWSRVLVYVATTSVTTLNWAGRSDGLQGLLDNNPFFLNGEASTKKAPELPIELRGIVVEGDDYLFNLYNPSTKQSAWVRQGETVAQYRVKGYDRAKEVLMLDAARDTLALAMKDTSGFSVTLGRDVRDAPGDLKPRAHPTEVVVAISKAEQGRLAKLAEEIHSRRLQRGQVSQSDRN